MRFICRQGYKGELLTELVSDRAQLSSAGVNSPTPTNNTSALSASATPQKGTHFCLMAFGCRCQGFLCCSLSFACVCLPVPERSQPSFKSLMILRKWQRQFAFPILRLNSTPCGSPLPEMQAALRWGGAALGKASWHGEWPLLGSQARTQDGTQLAQSRCSLENQPKENSNKKLSSPV